MMTQGLFRPPMGYLLLVLLILFATGCGGGGGSSSTTTSNPKNLATGLIPITAVFLNEVATLDGSRALGTSTDATFTYSWSFTSKPKGSNSQLQNADTATPSFTADKAGTYLVQLMVAANGVSRREVAVVIVWDPNNPISGIFSDGKHWHHKGLSSNCVNCHSGNYVINATDVAVPKSGDHLATSNQCQTCHTPYGFDQIVHFDHHEVFDTCSNCHNGVLAVGKSQFHIATSAECNTCHDTDKFVVLQQNADGSYDHTGIEEPCSACHNGVVATGKINAPVPHISTTKECGFCHSSGFGFFKVPNAYPDHSNITQPCTDCHSGTNPDVKGPTPAHEKIMMIAGIDCDLCHNTTSFTVTAMDHSVVDPAVVPCKTCHYDNNNFTLTVRSTASDPNQHPTLTPDQDCYLCHDTTNFANTFDHTAVIGQPCGQSGCHDGNTTGVVGVPTDGSHIPLTLYNEDCGVCHTSPGGTFKVGNFDHTTHAVAGICATCHNNVITGGQPTNHIPTTPPLTQECSDCHIATKFDNFKGAVVDHSAISSNCVSCHDGNIAIGQPTTHVPTPSGVDCSVCHVTGGTATPSPFAPANNFAHQTSPPQDCRDCHNGGYTLANNTAVMTQPATTHIPTIDNCYTCHTDTTIPGGFKTQTFFTTIHPTYKNGCQSCHTGKYPPALSKNDAPTPPGHVPTTQDCSDCHVNTDFKDTSNFTHKGITKDCVSCHNGTYRSLNALSTQDDPTPGGHPNIGNLDCYNCHITTGTSFANPIVDHSTLTSNCARAGCHDGATTGVPGQNAIPNHLPTSLDCVACHTPGGTFTIASFDHTTLAATTRCDSCHDGNSAGVLGTNAKPDHWVIDPATQDCGDCHSTVSFTNGKYNHNGVTDNCVSCHNGTNAPGKPTSHVPTSQDCHLCHTTASVAFKPATFAHNADQLSSTACKTCHSGDYPAAQGQGPNHQDTTGMNDCSDCHDTVDWYNAGFNHAGVTNNCARSGCHDGSKPGIRSKSSITTHLDTALDCVKCHTIGGSFVTNKWDHSQNTTGCSVCHGDNPTNKTPYNTAPRKPSNHFVTTQDCLECHNTSAWLPNANFTHSTPNYPGDHSTRRITSCDQCHTDRKETIAYPYSTYAPSCAACHANRYSSGDHGGRSVSTNQNCGKSGCHRVSSSSF